MTRSSGSLSLAACKMVVNQSAMCMISSLARGGLADSAHLEVPPPYRPEPGLTVYEVRAGERVAQVAEGNLAGLLRNW